MKLIKKIPLIFIIVATLSKINLYGITDYTLDISPEIKSPKMFSAGYAFSYGEYNGIFSDGTLYYGELGDVSHTFISTIISMTPYFEYRPWSFLQLGLSTPFSYTKKEEYDSLIYNETITENWSFDAVHAHAKVAIIDWFVSLGFRMDFAYNFSNTFGKKDDLDIYGKIFIGIIPKKIPLNFLINYTQGFNDNRLAFGELQGALEFITSDIITLAVGANYVFPYTEENSFSYVEVFAKLGLFFDDYVSGNVSYSKIFYGEDSGNNATFLINISYHF